MPEQEEAIRKPSWSLDVKIISHVADMLDATGDIAIKLELGDPNQLFVLKALLQEVYLRLGGDLESDGSMLLKEAKNDLKVYFEKLNEWEEKNIQVNIEKQKIDAESYKELTYILRMIRLILYSEVNRLFVRFITIYSESQKMERYSLARTKTD